MLLHHLTNSGVPLALRDAEEDEKSRPAKMAGAVAGVALGTLDTAVNTVTSPAAEPQTLSGRELEDASPNALSSTMPNNNNAEPNIDS